MSRRILELSLLAYPRETRGRDGAHLLDLAEELAHGHGTTREALGLLRGGLTERHRRRRPRRVALAVSAAAASVLVALTWSAAAGPLRVEEDQFSCVAECVTVVARVADLERDGWTCHEGEAGATVTWRCTRD